ncbi:MAG: GIY-YIG nuclease family protein [Candidatus Margulisiibacteriota bacterium]
MPYFVYILECGNNSLYTGITSDLDRRMKEHFSGKGCKYTSSFKAQKLRYAEEYDTRSQATKREAQIKGWTRTKKLALIKGHRRKAT